MNTLPLDELTPALIAEARAEAQRLGRRCMDVLEARLAWPGERLIQALGVMPHYRVLIMGQIRAL